MTDPHFPARAHCISSGTPTMLGCNLIILNPQWDSRITRPAAVVQKVLLSVNPSVTNRKIHFHGSYKSSFGKSGPDPRLTSSVIIANITAQHSDLVNGALLSEIHLIPGCLFSLSGALIYANSKGYVSGLNSKGYVSGLRQTFVAFLTRWSEWFEL